MLGGSKRSLVCKLMMMMLLLTHLAFSSENAFSQQSITVRFEQQTLSEVLNVLKQKTGYEFLYNDEEIKDVTGITRSFSNASIQDILNSCLTGTKYTFKMVDNLIVITPDNKKDEVKKVTVQGKVVDDRGTTLPGVTVLLKGTAVGVVTDIDGKFKIELPKRDTMILIFSFVGMKSHELDVNKIKDLGKEVSIKMFPDTEDLEEVVVTGYANVKKESFTGSSISVKREDLLKASATNVVQALASFDPSFRIQENNQWGSDPNAIPEMYIRGRSGVGIKELDKDQLSKSQLENNPNLPLFIMDGFEISARKLYDFDPNRIENVTILKDAAATAMYGSRAANGVVVITTIAPKPNKIMITYNMTGTVMMPDLSDYNLMNAREKLQYEKEAGLYTQEITPGYEDNDRREQGELDKAYYNRYKNIVEGVNTYWLSQPVKNAFSHAHSLFVEGGADNVRYGIDASYNQNKGVMKESGRDRFGLGFSLIYRIKDKITIKNYISYAHTHAYNSPYGSFSQYAKLNPYERIYNDNGELIPKLSDGDTNPLYDALLPNRNFTKDQEFREQLSVDWFIRDGLRLKGQMAIVKGETSGEIYKSPFSAEFLKTTYNSESRVQEYLPIAERGYLSMTDGASFSYDGNVTLNYNTLVNEKHIIYAGVGLEVTQNDNNSHGFIMTGFPDDRYSDPAFAIQYKKETKPSSSESKSRAIGFFANGNYSYDDRYFADVSVRIDGSSKFGADKKYAPFWSAGAGWNVHNEKFFKHTKISMLKLRYSYGVTGNQEFSAYQAKTMFQFNTDRLYNSGISAALMGYGNPDLEWQNQYQSNYGFDFGYAKDRIRLQFNYYQKKTEGMLTSVSVAPSLGLPSNTFTSNLGKIQNKGVEVNLNAVLIRDQGKDFEWSVMLQAAHNKNKIMEISTALKNINEKNNQDKTTPAAVYEEGESMSAIKAVPSLGIDPTTGQELFMKKDGTITYTWDATDKVICGDSEPKVFGNVGTNLYWKGWNLNMVFKYDLGADYYNSTLAERVEGANPRYNADRRVLNNRWKEPGQHALYKNIKEYTTTYISSRFVQKENTLQLTSLSLSYDLNREWIRKFGLNTMRLSFYMNDVFRASTVKNERGLDYPFQRSFVFGLNIGF